MEKKQNELVAKLSDAKLAAVKQQASVTVYRTARAGCRSKRLLPCKRVKGCCALFVQTGTYSLLVTPVGSSS